jgi:hypothetical protein
MASKNRLQAKAAKQKRQKMLAIGGAVLLVAVLAIQVPRTMKMINGGGSAAPAPTASESAGVVPDPAAQAIAATAEGTLPDPNVAPEPADGQLTSFELFQSKDPFVQQVVDTGESADGGSSSGEKGEGSSKSGGEESAPGSAVISVNGVESTAEVSGSFPQDDPAFVLVSASGKTARVGIAGGSFSDGAATITLRLGKKLTLVNTVDGTRYELVLVSTS